MLLGNRTVLHKLPLRFLAGSTVSTQTPTERTHAGMRRNRFYQDGTTVALKTYSVPQGTYPPSGLQKAGTAFILPQRAGAIASYNEASLSLSPTALAVGGITTTGNATFVIDTNIPAGELISSGNGTASFAITANSSLLTASLNAIATTTFTITGGTTTLTALGNGIGGTASFVITGTVTPYAVGSMSGNTVDGTTLTTAALIAAMNANPPGVNIKKVNDVIVNGTGAPGNTWGP